MYRSSKLPLAYATAAAALCGPLVATGAAQTATGDEVVLPPVVVEQTEAPAQKTKKKAAASKATAPSSAPVVASDPVPSAGNDGVGITVRAGSLTVPNTAEAQTAIQQTPGGVALVPGSAYQASTPASTVKDVLDYVPGVFVQPKWGDDSRLSIRGSGLSRNFHLRSVQLFMDGIPINTADGYGDFQEIDPTVYRYTEVFKGGNALRFGANSLGGAINFVIPTGYDADTVKVRTDFGSYGFHKLSVSSGGVVGAADYFIAGTWAETDGFREHSSGESVRGSMNVGYRLSENVETRFYINANHVRQDIPGSLTRQVALTTPDAANPGNIALDQQRNIDTVRIANKTAIRLAPGTLLEFGAFGVDRHLMHPIYQWLDYRYRDYGAFARIADESRIAGLRNRFIGGVNIHNGTVDNKHYANVAGSKGVLMSSSEDTSENLSVYAENALYILSDVALVGGVQFLHATRDRRDRFLANGDQSGDTEFNLWSPKVGVLWDVTPDVQVFANISRSAEVPSYGESSAAAQQVSFTDIRPQRATTYEIGTRGRTADYTWDLSLYRASIDNELLCFTTPNTFGSTCQVANADRTIHQGVELGFGAAIARGLLTQGSERDELWLNTAYTFNDFRYDNDATWGDNELPGAPRHFLRAEMLYRHPTGFYFGPNVEWVPEAYYVDSANTFKTASYAIWGAKVGFDNGGPVSAYIEGRNLSDEAYIASASTSANLGGADAAVFEAGTGRAFYAGVQFKW